MNGGAVVVTGAGSGIGRAVALACAERDWPVALIDTQEEGLKALSAELRGVTHSTRVADVSATAALATAIDEAEAELGKIAGLVTCAGVHGLARIGEISLDEWRAMLDINALGTLNAVQATLPALRRGGGGAMVLVSSLSGVRGHPAVGEIRQGGAHYAASKGAVIAFAKSVALEVAAEGIRVNCVAPAMVDTPLVRRSYTDEQISSYERTVPLGRIGQAADIAGAVEFLLSDSAAFITGQVINVCGGVSLV